MVKETGQSAYLPRFDEEQLPLFEPFLSEHSELPRDHRVDFPSYEAVRLFQRIHEYATTPRYDDQARRRLTELSEYARQVLHSPTIDRKEARLTEIRNEAVVIHWQTSPRIPSDAVQHEREVHAIVNNRYATERLRRLTHEDPFVVRVTDRTLAVLDIERHAQENANHLWEITHKLNI